MCYLQSAEGMANTAHNILLTIAHISGSKVFIKRLHNIVIPINMTTLHISDPTTHPTTSQSMPTHPTVITILLSPSYSQSLQRMSQLLILSIEILLSIVLFL